MATSRPVKKNDRIWLSYDLGLKGDYAALYEWLDEKDARECGDSVATFMSNMNLDQIRDSLLEILGDSPKARIYIITRDTGGKFLVGKRKAAPWAGYFENALESVLDQ
jgi:hypothetical protein